MRNVACVLWISWIRLWYKRALILTFFSVLAGAAVASPAFAQSPTLKMTSSLGGPGDQRGTGIFVQNGAIFVVGNGNGSNGPGEQAIVARYAIPPTSTPVWVNSSLDGNFHGITATASDIFPVGYSYDLTTDNVGSKEIKSILAEFAPDGSTGGGPGGSLFLATAAVNPNAAGSTAFFSYSGFESFEGAATQDEGGSAFIYAVGGGQPCSYGAYLVAKYDTSGHFVGAATDSSVGISFGNCFTPSVGSSIALGAVALDGDIYLAGASGWPSEGDFGNRAALYKYDPTLALQWRAKDTTAYGQFNSVATLGSDLYAVGYTYVPGQAGSEDYLIEKYDELGNLVWRQNFGGTNTDILTGVTAVGGRLFAVGYTRSQGSGGADAVILEIDPSTGSILSTTLWGGAQDDMANGVATDGTDLYVVGESRSYAAPDGNAVGQDDIVLLDYGVGSGQPSTTTVSSSANPSVFGQSATLTATVAPSSGTGTPTGTVTFTDASTSTTLGTATLISGQAPVTISTLAVGTHTITAQYSGDSSFQASSGSISQQVVYSICLLYDPTRSVHSGAVYPIKLYLCDANGSDVSSSGITLHATSVSQVSGFSGTPESPGNANPDLDFRYDSTLGPSGGYIFNLSTQGLASGTYQLNFSVTGDPLSHTVSFGVN
jgi:Bacterial Ig-like domain (group 3)